MIDLNNVEQYRENNRIEAKKALGGLPHSIWETYSAFANTLGGILLLGVEEYRDKTFHVVDLPDPERLVKEFWEKINDRKIASVNILSDDDVRIETVNGCRIIAIEIPRAGRMDKPVYIKDDPWIGSYRRSGEGDYKCTRDEISSMMRDAALKTQDMKLLPETDINALSRESIEDYRSRLENIRTSSIAEALTDDEFLCEIGAAENDGGKITPSAAGLLMFGRTEDIKKEFPEYILSYEDETSEITSEQRDWSGNIYDFYFKVRNLICTDDAPSVCGAICEALSNCLTNADYYGRGGLRIVKRRKMITISNPGSFRIAVEAAESGGRSDPRNAVLNRMFNLINIGEGLGSGLPGIYSLWRRKGWSRPAISESFEPDRITVMLPLGRIGRRVQVRKSPVSAAIRHAAQREAVIAYLTDNISAKPAELAAFIGVSTMRMESILRDMEKDEVIGFDSVHKTYKMKD